MIAELLAELIGALLDGLLDILCLHAHCTQKEQTQYKTPTKFRSRPPLKAVKKHANS